MTNRDLLLRNRQRQAQKADVKPRYRAVLCAQNGSRDAGSVWANENAKLVYFQFFGSGGVGIARCEKLVPELGLGVYVGKTDDNLAWQVLEDDPLLRRNSTDNRNYQSVAARDLKPGGRLFLWVDSRQIDPLATYPTPNSLSVNVAPGDYAYDGERKTFPGALDYDLSASVPSAGLHRYVGLYLDSSNTLQTVNGATTSTANTPAEPTWPDGAFRLSVVRLRNGQTSIIFTLKNDSTNDILDRRMLWSDENSGGGASTLTIKNTSGATANVGDTGYVNEAGEYKVFTSGNATANWCIVMTGGANNADIEVTSEGVVAINYGGSAPSAGQFLVTSSTPGLAALSALGMRPEVFAVCITAGSGGVVSEALLLTKRKSYALTSANNIFSLAAASTSDFRATINGAPSGATLVYNAPSSGAENTINVGASTELGKIRLYNETRNNHALISSVNTATNVITVTAAGDISAWQSGDTITTRSQTNTSNPMTNSYFYDIEFSTSEIPPLTTEILLHVIFSDSAVTRFISIHPWETNANPKRFTPPTIVASAQHHWLLPDVAINSSRFCVAWDANGSGTAGIILRVRGVTVAAP